MRKKVYTLRQIKVANNIFVVVLHHFMEPKSQSTLTSTIKYGCGVISQFIKDVQPFLHQYFNYTYIADKLLEKTINIQ
jgi:hypothetical protein